MYQLIIFCFLLSISANAQFNKEHNLNYEETITVEGKTQAQLKEKFHKWMLSEFDKSNIKASKNTDNEILLDIASQLDIKQGNTSMPIAIYFGILSEFEDNQFKIQINHIDVGPTKTPVKIDFPDFKSFKKEMQETVNHLSGDAKAKNQAILDDEKKIKQIYNRGLNNHNNMLTAVKKYITELVKKMKNYIK
ncbi:DUF4468 domain-containing protein [Zunongwangia sp.]|uniref:DUF4468 domain-containing protein n=1 Tax=Zunongwangia sp. TaxID=1965325 RepID=UPI003AA8A8C4